MMRRRLGLLARCVGALVVVLAGATVALRGQSGAPSGEWRTYGGDLGMQLRPQNLRECGARSVPSLAARAAITDGEHGGADGARMRACICGSVHGAAIRRGSV